MTYKKKLIEVALPLAKINVESAREKSIRLFSAKRGEAGGVRVHR